jgi:NAD(P)-dependent dehydrogenase (short-subunit alcohol dehydrogenase family)
MNLPNFEYEVINLEDPQMINRGFRNIMIKLKGKVDSLIFCHGKFFSGNIKETSILLFDNAMNINFRSYFHLLSMATPFLKLSKGNVCFTTCNLGKNPQENTFLFSLTNSMLYSLVENSALELAPFGVRVNAVSPHLVNTEFRVGPNNMTEQENFQYMSQFEKNNLFLLGGEVF